ncbi:MAG TPA: hydantoinase B/oxoprolinase family protein, partial [Hyphomicrobiaceae bacterium]|nr:hydantoinase B/oxoprolinase family protein [Hyphomicrobiaceae bacterium]
RLEAEEATLSVRADRATVQPFGLYGGSPGAPSENWFNPDAADAAPRRLPSKPTMTFRKGDVFRHIHAGGGGWGDPLDRDPQAVLADVRNEFLSTATAEADYGVVIDQTSWTVNDAETRNRQDAIRRNRGWTEVPKVQRAGTAKPVRAAE